MSPVDDRGPPDKRDEDRRLLALERFVAGDASPDDARLARDVAADERGAEIIEALRRIRETLATRVPPTDVDRAWERFEGALLAEPPTVPTGPEGAPRRVGPAISLLDRRQQSRVHRIVAGTAALAGAALVIMVHARATANRPLHTVGDSAAKTRVFASARGQRAEVRLTDGSRIVLAADSRLTVPPTFDRAERRVFLEGEAYFDVVHDSTRPFRVAARNADVRDVGTRFEVRAYSTDPAVRVVVINGTVRVGDTASTSRASLLHAGGMARIAANGFTSIRQHVDTLAYVGWTSGVLLLRGGSLRDVAAELSRWYDVDIHIPDSAVAARRISARIDYEALDRVLDHLALALDLQVTRRGRVITFASHSAAPR
jgi:transmembrane sensor